MHPITLPDSAKFQRKGEHPLKLSHLLPIIHLEGPKDRFKIPRKEKFAEDELAALARNTTGRGHDLSKEKCINWKWHVAYRNKCKRKGWLTLYRQLRAQKGAA